MNIHCAYKELVPIDDLRPHPKNPNRHSPEQVTRLAKILKYQGWRVPIKVSTTSGYITSGHGRLLAARERTEKRVHPTQKPIALAEWFFERWGKDAKNIWDGYLGSGSTLIACEKTNRRCFGMEIDPHYVDIVIARFEKFTGQKAELVK